MKWLVAVGALAIGMTAFVVRSPAAAESASVHRAAGLGSAVLEIPVSFLSDSTSPVSLPSPSSPVPSILATAPAARALADRESEDDEAGRDREHALLVLEHELGLNAEQKRQVARILRERDAEVVAFHEEIRASKVFWIWGHEKKVREILASSQVRVASVLSADQSRGYFRMLEEGRLLEGASFEITPGLTVLR